jgi:hypothetical protein
LLLIAADCCGLLLMVADGSWWSLMVADGRWWSLIATDCRWLQVPFDHLEMAMDNYTDAQVAGMESR